MGNKRVLLTRGVKRFGRGALAFLASVMVFGGIVPSTVFAADTTANTLKVTPVRSDIEIPAGQKKTVPVTVSNVTDSPILVRAITNDFVAGDERGTPAIILDPNAFPRGHRCSRRCRAAAGSSPGCRDRS